MREIFAAVRAWPLEKFPAGGSGFHRKPLLLAFNQKLPSAVRPNQE
jgi:hypothetical protein